MTDGSPKKIAQPWELFDNLLDAIFIVDQERQLFYANESFRHLCDAPRRAVSSRESVNKYIELPEECWQALKGDVDSDGESGGYREVGFITKNGTFGRAQVLIERANIPTMSEKDLYFAVLRDVTVEARLHAKYKVQIENNERLIADLQRSLDETAFLRRLATDIPIHADTVTLLNTISTRLKAELGFRDAHFLKLPEDQFAEIEPVGIDKRMGSRLRELIRYLGPAIRDTDSSRLVTSVLFKPFGSFWITYFRPRLEKPVVLIASAGQQGEDVDHRTLLEALSGQVSTLLDNRALYFASITDTLTGLFNRRFFDSRFGIECMRSQEKHTPLTLVMIDVDHFKKVNDEYGHPAGDAVLNALGTFLKRRIRTSDFAARVGGEEFALLLPDTSPNDARNLAESIRAHVENMAIPLPGGKELKVTVSLGIAGYHWNTDTQASVYQTADEALYAAKQGGRNRIVVKDTEEDQEKKAS